MNRNDLQRLASEWVRMAKNDIRTKATEMMEETNATLSELAYNLGMSDGELNQIVNGNGEITLTTFAKLLIASGFALEIKPVGMTPIGNFENVPCDENRACHRTPRPNIFERQRPQTERRNEEEDFARPRIPTFDEFCRMMDEQEANNRVTPQPRDSRGRFMSRNTQNTNTTREDVSPFDNMERGELVNIINERLWDSEIDVDCASKGELVTFLKEKDKRMKEIKRMRELEEDPKIVEFKKRLKKTIAENPHLREWTKKLLGEA